MFMPLGLIAPTCNWRLRPIVGTSSQFFWLIRDLYPKWLTHARLLSNLCLTLPPTSVTVWLCGQVKSRDNESQYIITSITLTAIKLDMVGANDKSWPLTGSCHTFIMWSCEVTQLMKKVILFSGSPHGKQDGCLWQETSTQKAVWPFDHWKPIYLHFVMTLWSCDYVRSPNKWKM